MLVLFWIMALVLVFSAVSVVLCKNPIYSALALVLNLLGVAVIFASLDAHFLAAVQVVVYAGAIMVLVVFVLMLLNTKVETEDRFRSLYLVVAALAGATFAVVLGREFVRGFPVLIDSASPATQGSVANIGTVLYTRFVFPFEAASLLIMAAIVGAVVLAKRKYSDTFLSPRS